MLDIIGKAVDSRAARLSNFTDRPFVFDLVQCAGLEGILQALKCPVIGLQWAICRLSGKAAKQRGSEFNWQDSQRLWWQDRMYYRASREYFDLITRIYDAVYEQDPSFKQDLLAIGFDDIAHSIGNTDMQKTVLTEVEMIHQLNRLRIRAIRESR